MAVSHAGACPFDTEADAACRGHGLGAEPGAVAGQVEDEPPKSRHRRLQGPCGPVADRARPETLRLTSSATRRSSARPPSPSSLPGVPTARPRNRTVDPNPRRGRTPPPGSGSHRPLFAPPRVRCGPIPWPSAQDGTMPASRAPRRSPLPEVTSCRAFFRSMMQHAASGASASPVAAEWMSASTPDAVPTPRVRPLEGNRPAMPGPSL